MSTFSGCCWNFCRWYSQSGQRLIPWPSDSPPVGASGLVSCPVRAQRSTLVSLDRYITTKPQVVGRAPSVLTRSSAQRHQLDELEGIFRSWIERGIIAQDSADSVVSEGSRLISAGYSRCHIHAIAQAWRKFCLFCRDKGQRRAPCSSSRISATYSALAWCRAKPLRSMYSAVKLVFDLLGLQAPGRMPNSSELAFEVQTSMRGFTQRHLMEDHILPTPTTPAVLVFELCNAAKGLRFFEDCTSCVV
jgi:hypothetical protein